MEGSADLRFGVMADVQYCNSDPAGSRFYRWSPGKLEACVKHLNQLDLAFVIQLGDLIDADFHSFDRVVPILARLRHPVHHVLGNHDFTVAADDKAGVPGRLAMTAPHYAFTSGRWRLVALNGNDLSVIAHPEGSARYREARKMLARLKAAGRPNAQAWNGALGNEQLAWLEAQLALAEAKQERVIVFCHWPVYPSNPHNLWNDTAVLDILAGHECVAAYMNGHNHKGHYGLHQGLHCITFKGMVEHEDRTAYAVVHCGETHMAVMGYGDENSRSLPYRVMPARR